MKHFSTIFFFLTSTLFFTTCKEKDPTPRAYPRVKTLDVTDINNSGASFQAEIIFYANSGIDDHGFVWGRSFNPTINVSNQKSLGAKSGTGIFRTTVNSNLIEGEVYYVRAYAKNKDYTVYGKEVAFKSLGGLSPKISGFTPDSGYIGDTITIEGANLAASLKEYVVKFDTIPAKAVSANENAVRVIVPNEILTKASTISITLAQQTATSTDKFNLHAPNVISFSPLSGVFGDRVTIEGKGFSANNESNTVKFGSIAASVIQSSFNKVVVQVPSGVQAGPVKISVTVAGQTALTATDFISLSPDVVSFFPETATFGEDITISGANFSSNLLSNVVKFGDVTATVKAAATNQLTVVVPNQLTVKSSVISVSINDQIGSSKKEFVLLPPVIASFSPEKGAVTETITISGKNFSPILNNNEVRIGSEKVTIKEGSSTSLSVTVPPTLAVAENKISVTVAQQTDISNKSFYSPWINKARSRIANDWGVSFSIGNKGYFLKGASVDPEGNFWEYDPATNVWTKKADFIGILRNLAVGFSVNGKGYVGLGTRSNSQLKDFWEYDPEKDTWTRKADFPGVAREKAVGFTIGNRAFVGLGQVIGIGMRKDFWEYNSITDTWIQRADFGGEARVDAVSFAINDKGYIGLGTNSKGPWSYTKDFWEYNPVSDSWLQKSDFAGGETGRAIGFGIGDKGYVGTGDTNDGRTRAFWQYNPVNDTWTQKVSFGGPARRDAKGFVIGGKGYVGAGYGYSTYTDWSVSFKYDFWEYDPIKD